MQTSQDIISALQNPAIAMGSEDIRTCWDLLKARHSSVQALQAQAFRVGDKVEFDARGTVHKGVVKKVNQKSVSVEVKQKTLFGPDSTRERTVNWKVAPSMLRKLVQ